MNTDNGALEFEGVLNNKKLDDAVEQSEKKIQGFVDKAEKAGEQINEMFDVTTENVTIQKKAIADLEKEYNRLTKEINKLPSGSAQATLARQALGVKEEIDAEKAALEQMQKALADTDQKTASLRQRKKELTAALAEMEMAGQRGTAEYNAMRQELATLTDQMGDTATQARVLASDTANFDGLLSGLNGVVGGFTAMQGVVGLVAGENENLAKIMTKVQSLMAITMGFQQLSNTLNKDSAFILVTVNKAKELWNAITGKSVVVQTAETAAEETNATAKEINAAATTGAAVAQTAETAAAGAGTVANWSLAAAFRAVGTAIKSIPVFGWILAGISGIIALVEMFTDSEEDNTKAIKDNEKALKDQEEQMSATDRVMKAVGESTDQEKTRIETLTRIIHDNTIENRTRQKAIDELKKIIPGYNALLNSEGKITRENTKAVEDYIDALDRMAMAKAVQSELEKLSQKELQQRLAATKAQKTMDSNNWVNEQDKRRAEEARNPNIQQSDATRTVTSGSQQADADARTARANYQSAEKNLKAAKEEMAKIKKDKDELFAIIKEDKLADAIVEEPKGTSLTSGGGRSGGSGRSGKNDPQVKTYKEKLDAIKSLYEQYNKWRNSSDAQVREAAEVEFADLTKQGASYLEYLQNQRAKLEVTGKQTATTKQQLKDLNDAIATATNETVLSNFTQSLKDQLANTDDILKKLDIIAEKRKELANDGSDLDQAQSKALDDEEDRAKEQLKAQQKSLLEQYAAYNDKRIQMAKEFNANLRMLEAARDAEGVSEADQKKIQAAIDNYKRVMDKVFASSGDEEYDSMLQQYMSFEDKKAAITKEYDEKRRIATLHGNQALVEQLNKEEQTAQTKNAFDALKANPDYVKAFDDLKAVSDTTLKSLLERFDEVKEAAARDLDTADFKEYMSTIKAIVDEMNSRNPFAGLIKAYGELKKSAAQVEAAQKKLKKVEKENGKGSKEYAVAEKELIAAQDKHIKKLKDVRNAERTLKGQVDELCKALDDVGKAIGGEAGEIISLIADIGSFVMNTIDSFKMVVGATAQAMSTMEKASVILTVISAAWQLAQKIATIFGGDGGEADYQRASEVYKEYIAVLDDVIAKQKELMDTLAGADAKGAYKTALALVEQQADAARELGKQYLNAGASSGFLGIGSKASHGVDQRKNISGEGWQQLTALYKQGIITIQEYSNIANGRMTGLFDLTAEKVRALYENAPIFWANLAEDTRTYLKQIMECADSTEELANAMKEALTGVSFDSMEDDFLKTLQDMDVDAKTFANNFSEYMRKAMIQQMYKNQYKKDLQRWYDMFADAMDPDGDGGAKITETEQNALNTLRDSIVKGATAAAEAINKQFETADVTDPDSMTGAIQSVTEETAGKIEGQMQAIRINQMEMVEIERQALQYLAIMASNSGYLVYLRKIDDILNRLDSSSDARRGQGIA